MDVPLAMIGVTLSQSLQTNVATGRAANGTTKPPLIARMSPRIAGGRSRLLRGGNAKLAKIASAAQTSEPQKPL